VTRLSVGFAAMLERLAPREAVDLAVHAERSGFSGVMASDHFQPWTPTQGQSPFVWNVLTAIAEHTTGDLGIGAAGMVRMHPAAVAQASATLAAMHPGRHWLGLGAGDAVNEHIVGQYWPEAAERITRMFEGVEVVQKLFASARSGRDVKHSGAHYRLESSRLWTMSEQTPPLLIATGGPVTAKRAGRHVDGIVTQGAPYERVAALFSRFDEGVRETGRMTPTLKVLQLHLSWAPTEQEALANAHANWPVGAMRFGRSDIRSPFEIEQLARLVRPEDFEGRVVISSDPDVHRAAIQRYADLGADRVYLHNAGPDQRTWIDVFARDVLPGLTR
jgi:coenzyme F420-dependent glucose-6-phosphate dehydrogenase